MKNDRDAYLQQLNKIDLRNVNKLWFRVLHALILLELSSRFHNYPLFGGYRVRMVITKYRRESKDLELGANKIGMIREITCF